MKAPYPKTHLWLLIPFGIVLLGFRGYWLDFRSATFLQHVHGLSAVVWFVFLILQPWLIDRGRYSEHRRWGMIGIFVAGMTAASALLIIKGNLLITSGPFQPFKYSLAFIDLYRVAGFVLFVVMAVIQSNRLQVHARWMIGTIFWILDAATLRLSMYVLYHLYEGSYHMGHLMTANFIFPGFILFLLIAWDYRQKSAIHTPYVIVMIVNWINAGMLWWAKDVTWLERWLEKLLLP